MNHPIERVLVTKLSEQVALQATEGLRKLYGNANTAFVSAKGCELYHIYVITDYKLSNAKASKMREKAELEAKIAELQRQIEGL